jgi:hypothetical protein
MSESLLDRFLTEEANEYVRELLMREFQTRTSGSRRFTFDVFNVRMDFDASTATIEDVLEADSSYSMPLRDFEARVGSQT